MSEGMEEIVRRKPGRPPRGDRAELRPTSRAVRDTEEFGEFNEFDNHSVLPYVPDTRDWHYLWVRVSVQGAVDGKNLSKHLNGTVRYEAVPASEMPGLVHFKASNAAGTNGDVIQVDDVVLMRCSRSLHEKQLRYYDHVAAQKSATLKAQTKERMGDSRLKVTYTDKEDTTTEDGGEE